MTQLRRAFVLIALSAASLTWWARPAEAQLLVRTFVGSAPHGGCFDEPTGLFAVAVGAYAGPRADVSVGGIRDNCGNYYGTPEFLAFGSLHIFPATPMIHGHQFKAGLSLDLDWDFRAMSRALGTNPTGEKYLFFRPAFTASYALLGWGTSHSNSSMSEGVLWVETHMGNFRGHGAFFTIGIVVKANP